MGLIRGRLRACHVRTVSIGRLEIQVWLSSFPASLWSRKPWFSYKVLCGSNILCCTSEISKASCFQKLSMQRPKRPFGEFITHPPSPPSFSTDDDSWRNEHSKGSLPDAGEEEAVRLPSVRLLCALSSNASVCTSICKA